MAFQNFGIGLQIGFIIPAGEITIEFNSTPRHRTVIRINFEFEDSAADFHAQTFLAGENRLALESGHPDNMNVSFLHVVAHMVMSLDQNGGFLAAL